LKELNPKDGDKLNKVKNHLKEQKNDMAPMKV